MTGVGFKVMKFTKIALATLVMVMSGSTQTASASTATTTVTINVTVTQPSCHIMLPSSYDLGTLTPGSKEHNDLKITWSCEGEPLKTALTAGIVTGIADGDTKVRLMADGRPAGATLSLREKGGNALIKLTGHNAKGYFCEDKNTVTGMRSCTLTPITNVETQGPFGKVSATLNFAVSYP